jgi:hypothetical protein
VYFFLGSCASLVSAESITSIKFRIFFIVVFRWHEIGLLEISLLIIRLLEIRLHGFRLHIIRLRWFGLFNNRLFFQFFFYIGVMLEYVQF